MHIYKFFSMVQIHAHSSLNHIKKIITLLCASSDVTVKRAGWKMKINSAVIT